MELYWKIRSSLYADSLRYKLIQKIYVMYSNNCTQLEVYTVLMIRTCTAVGCNYYEFELLAAVDPTACSLIDTSGAGCFRRA